MKKLTIAAALTAATMLATPAHAGNPEGKLQVKLLATGVLPDGKIDSVNKDLIGLPAGSQSTANDNVVPTLAVEYFATPNVSIETICCFTQHHVSGAGALAGADLAQHVLILPATVTLKYHFGTGKGIKPYIGAGPSVFFYFDEKPGATAKALGAASLKMDNRLGVAVQAGVDIPLGESGLGLSLDAKRYFMKAKTHFYTAGGVEALSTTHKLDPWVISGGVFARF